MSYVAIGEVRGMCEHKHRTLIGAQKCCDQDNKYCVQYGGYSDRYVAAHGRELTDEEKEALHQYYSHAKMS